MITTVLFDLDGTLLPMDNDAFTRGYFKLLAAKLAPRGYEPEALIAGIWAGVAAMVTNDGSRSNEEAFWERFAADFGAERCKADREVFEDFYAHDFAMARPLCGFAPEAKRAVSLARELGLRTALATNPLFPAAATLMRIGWAGLSPDDFELITTYENSVHCKPNPEYYRDVQRALGVEGRECLMVGNDALEDMTAAETGARCFLLTDCLINRGGADIGRWPHGGFAGLEDYLRGLRKEEMA